jgi:predicted nucleic acid-binding protein
VIVVDASAVLDVLLGLPGSAEVEHRLLESGDAMHAPELLDVEVAQVLRRHERRQLIPEAYGREALEILSGMPIRRHRHGPLLDRIWSLKKNLTAYDAAYIALAEALDAPLVTRDAALASAPGHRATVELL